MLVEVLWSARSVFGRERVASATHLAVFAASKLNLRFAGRCFPSRLRTHPVGIGMLSLLQRRTRFIGQVKLRGGG